jgi:hypothetical protein
MKTALIIKLKSRYKSLMRTSTVLILLLIAIALLFGVGLAADGLKNYGTDMGGVELMAASLIFGWIGLGGFLMFLARKRVRSFVQSSRGRWQTKFIVFATVLALTEEAVTTTLTNLAPIFGSQIGEAYITASSNYFEVVLYNSVIVFIPMFLVWAWLLSRWNFSPNAVLLLFGLNGVTAEIIYGGGTAALGTPMWILVYGLMVYLPAYSLPAERRAAKPPWYAYLLALGLPLIAAAIVAIIVLAISPYMPHFGPNFTN